MNNKTGSMHFKNKCTIVAVDDSKTIKTKATHGWKKVKIFFECLFKINKIPTNNLGNLREIEDNLKSHELRLMNKLKTHTALSENQIGIKPLSISKKLIKQRLLYTIEQIILK